MALSPQYKQTFETLQNAHLPKRMSVVTHVARGIFENIHAFDGANYMDNENGLALAWEFGDPHHEYEHLFIEVANDALIIELGHRHTCAIAGSTIFPSATLRIQEDGATVFTPGQTHESEIAYQNISHRIQHAMGFFGLDLSARLRLVS